MLKVKIKFNKLLNDDSGVALVLVALCLLVIIGFGAIVADAGLLYRTKRDMVASADACALAVAQEMADAMTVSKGTIPLTEDEAQTLAEKYKMRADSVDVSLIAIQLPDPDIEGAFKNYQAVKADVVRNEKYFFGKAISSKDSGNVRATATAIWEYPTNVAGGNILPFYSQISDFNEHLAYPAADTNLHIDADLINSQWGLFNIYSNSDAIKFGLRGGFDLDLKQDLTVGEYVLNGTAPGDKLNYTRDGIGESDKDLEKSGRIKRTLAGLTEMEGIITIVEDLVGEGMQDLKVVGFAYYKITDCVQSKDGMGLNGGPYYYKDKFGNFILDEKTGQKIPYEVGTVIGEFKTGITDIKTISGDQDQSHNFGAYDVKLTD